jgi:UDP-glucose 4-epimerase
MAQDTVIVFGGSGFLGSHVADALSDANYRVKIFDIRPSPYLQKRQEMIVGSVLDLDAVEKASCGCRYVYNFSGIADIDEAIARPLDTVAINVLGNTHAMEAARRNGAERFIYASTVYVYSEAGSFYRASKQASERFVEVYREQYGLNYTILRYGSLYGRRADERNGIYGLLKQAVEKKTIYYEGSGEALREYIHVTDAAKLSVQILAEEYINRHMVLTGHERLQVQNVMRMIAEMIPGGAQLQFGDSHIRGHYVMTPYAFHPKVGHKLVSNDYVDLGQGLLDCLAEIHEKSHQREHRETDGDWLIPDDSSKG